MDKLAEAREILEVLGYSGSRKSTNGPLTLLALTGIGQSSLWREAIRSRLGTYQIIEFAFREYGMTIAPNTRESIRKNVLKPLIRIGMVEQNPGRPEIPTNSALNHYALTESALEMIRRYGGANWEPYLRDFRARQAVSAQRNELRRNRAQVRLRLPGGIELALSAGRHNALAAEVVELMADEFFPTAQVVYIGDQAQKNLYVDEKLMAKLKLPLIVSDPLPDVILYDPQRDTVVFVEAVTSVGPVSDFRRSQLEELARNCNLKKLYLTAFPDFKLFSRFAGKLAWNTEVWVAERPDHLIHFNGQAYLKPQA